MDKRRNKNFSPLISFRPLWFAFKSIIFTAIYPISMSISGQVIRQSGIRAASPTAIPSASSASSLNYT